MKENIRERVLEIASYIVNTGATVRSAASVFDVSKSTVHSDMTVRLKGLDGALYEGVKKILGLNKQERHLRGGEQTRLKYKLLHENV